MFQKVYHVSTSKNRESILKKGLIPFGSLNEECNWKGLGYPKRIYVSLKPNDFYALDFVDYEGIDIWEFVVLKKFLKRDTVSTYKYHYYIEKCIPRKALRILKTIGYFKRILKLMKSNECI